MLQPMGNISHEKTGISAWLKQLSFTAAPSISTQTICDVNLRVDLHDL